MKLLLKIATVLLVGIVAIAQVNYEQALGKAQKVETDSEIESAMRTHGFHGDVFGKITVLDKVEAAFITLSSDGSL